MKCTEQDFERFADFLETESKPGGTITDFKTICKDLNLPRRKLNKLLMERFGTSGEDIVTCCRTHTPIQFL